MMYNNDRMCKVENPFREAGFPGRIRGYSNSKISIPDEIAGISGMVCKNQ